MDKITQQKRIAAYMGSHDGITKRDALIELGVANLPGRIFDLKKSGYLITSDWESGENRYGEKTRFVRYRLREEMKNHEE